MFRVIREIKPRFVIGENVPGIINLALDKVLTDLESFGYKAETFVIPSCAQNAPHRRDRVWIIAYKKEIQDKFIRHYATPEKGKEPRDPEDVVLSYSYGKRCEQFITSSVCDKKKRNGRGVTESENHWENKPGVGRVADGVSNRLYRIRGLGNAIVPQVAE